MPRTRVSKHPRRGTRGVRQHSRSLPEKKTVPHNSRLEDIIVEDITNLVKTEKDIKEWNTKFRSDKWENEERDRIKRFGKISSLIDGLEDDPYLPEKRIKMFFSGDIVETKMVRELPEISKRQVQLSVQRIVPKYTSQFNESFTDVKRNAPDVSMSNDSEIMSQVDNWSSYWYHLNNMRSGYENINAMTREHRDTPTVKMLRTHINKEVRMIDYEFYMRRKSNLFKQRIR